MSSFIATKFNPEEDEDRPQLKKEFNYFKNTYTVEKVSHCLVSDFIKKDAKEPNKEEFDIVALRGHVNRPVILWIIWGNLKNK